MRPNEDNEEIQCPRISEKKKIRNTETLMKICGFILIVIWYHFEKLVEYTFSHMDQHNIDWL